MTPQILTLKTFNDANGYPLHNLINQDNLVLGSSSNKKEMLTLLYKNAAGEIDWDLFRAIDHPTYDDFKKSMQS